MKTKIIKQSPKEEQALARLLIESQNATNFFHQKQSEQCWSSSLQDDGWPRKYQSQNKLKKFVITERGPRKFSENKLLTTNKISRVSVDSAKSRNSNVRKLISLQMNTRNFNADQNRKSPVTNRLNQLTDRKDIKVNNFSEVQQKLTELFRSSNRKPVTIFQRADLQKKIQKPISYSRYLKQKRDQNKRSHVLGTLNITS